MDQMLVQRLQQYNHNNVVELLRVLRADEHQRLLDDLGRIDFDQVAALSAGCQGRAPGASEKEVFQPADVLCFDGSSFAGAERRRLCRVGEDALAEGRVAVFLVAGGQGTRLGFSGPKGCYPVSPLRGKSLFQLFAESIRARSRRSGRALDWYIMTSHENDAQTRTFFEQHAWFGLAPENVHFIVQGLIPSLDQDGRLIVAPDRTIFKNPDGHGGSLYALCASGATDRMRERGVEEIFYFQVDNPLAVIADPLFIGAHMDRKADMSTKVVRKTDPCEKVGVIGTINGRLGCIEYSELPAEAAAERTSDGGLRFSSANTAMHMLNLGFIEKLGSDSRFHLPYHVACKPIDCLVERGGKLVQTRIEGRKFEMFIFDALAFAQRSVTLEVDRAQEFAPVKNSAGADSPETARRAMCARHRAWLARALGTPVSDEALVEISPLRALEAEEFLRAYRPPSASVEFPLYIA